MTLNPVIDRLTQDPEQLKANWTLPPEDARFLYLLARIGKFTRMLEIGTSIGFSTLHLAFAASQQQGHVVTIDADEKRQNQAKQHIAEAGLSEVVSFRLGSALSVLEDLANQGKTFDLMFLDARKSEYIEYFQYAQKLLQPNGLLIADNTRSHREDMTDFIQAVASAEDWESCDMQTPNGFVLARKK
jgi:predicted O-methyltransferase YrrM